MFNYKLDTFIEIPQKGELYIKIFNVIGQLKYTIYPKLCFFYTNSNILIIKGEDDKEIQLDFENSTIANEALVKLNTIKYNFIESTAVVTLDYLNSTISGLTSGSTYSAGSGITIDNLNKISANIDNSTIILNDSGQTQANVLYIERNYAASAVTTNTIGSTGLYINRTPISSIDIKIEGVSYDLTDDISGPFFFGNNFYTPIPVKDVITGTELFFNSLTADFALELTDEITITYNTNDTKYNFTSGDTTIFLKKTTADLIYLNTGQTSNWLSANTSFYTQVQTNSNFTSASTTSILSSQTWTAINNFSGITSSFTRTQADLIYLNTGQTSNWLSANTSFYTQVQTNSNFTSASTTLTLSSQTWTNINSIFGNQYIWDGNNIFFTKLNGFYIQQTIITGLTLTVNNMGAIQNATTIIKLKGDGVHTITLNGVIDNTGSILTGSEFDNTLNKVNVYLLTYIGNNVVVGTLLTKYIDITAPPTFQSANITNISKNKITLYTDLILDGSSIPNIIDFNVTESGGTKAISGVTIVGKNVELILYSNFSANTIVLLNYTAGVNPIRAGIGRDMSNLINQNVINNVTNPITLNPPSNFIATPISGNQINLTWNIVPNSINYEIWFSTDNINFNLLTNPSSASTSYPHSGLPISTTFYYYIKSIGDGISYMSSSNSSNINATTNSASALNTVIFNTPIILGNTSIGLSWSDVSNESGYQIQRSIDNLNWENIGIQLPPNTISFTDSGCTIGQIYYYRIQAIGIGAYTNSTWSSSVNLTITALLFSNAGTSADGTYLDITFNKNIVSGTTGITLFVNSFSSAFTYSISSGKLRITPITQFVSSDIITLSYSGGNVLGIDNTTLVDFSGQTVINNVIPLDSDYQLIYNAFINKPDTGLTNAQNAMVVGLKTDGIWTKLDVFVMCAIQTSIANIINWKNVLTNNPTWIVPPTFTALQGVQGDGISQYGDTNYSPNSGVNFTLNSMSLGIYVRNTKTGESSTDIGCYDGTNLTQLDTKIIGNWVQTAANCNVSNIDFTITNSNSSGFYNLNRTSSSSINVWHNGTKTTLSKSSSARPSKTFYLLARHDATPVRYSTDQIASYWIGSNLSDTEVANLSSRLNILMTYMGTNVY